MSRVGFVCLANGFEFEGSSVVVDGALVRPLEIVDPYFEYFIVLLALDHSIPQLLVAAVHCGES